MAKHSQPIDKGARDLGSGAYGFGRGNSASTALRIAGAQGSGGTPKSMVRRSNPNGTHLATGGHRVGCRPAGGKGGY